MRFVKYGRAFLARVATCFYSLYARTFRVEYIHDLGNRPEGLPGRPLIIGHWHEDDLAMIGPNRNRHYAVLISLSRDGDMLAYAMRRLGYEVVRGSSTRGGVRGLIRLIRIVRSSGKAIITVDGPTGPRRCVKSGIVALAAQTGVPILPVAAAAYPRFVFGKSWSKTYLPAPFARVVIVFHESLIPPPADNRSASYERCRMEVEETLHRLHKEAVRRVMGKVSRDSD